MTTNELATPPNSIELGELMAAAQRHDHHLSEAGLNVLRRLMFAYERTAPLAHEYLMQTDDAYHARVQQDRRTRIAELTAYAKERDAAGADSGPQWEEIRRLQKITD